MYPFQPTATSFSSNYLSTTSFLGNNDSNVNNNSISGGKFSRDIINNDGSSFISTPSSPLYQRISRRNSSLADSIFANRSSTAAPTAAAVQTTATHQIKNDWCKTVYVGNLDPAVDEKLLREVYEHFGNVLSIKICTDNSQIEFNYGYIEYDSHNDAQVAIDSTNATRILNNTIRVYWAFGEASRRFSMPNPLGALHLQSLSSVSSSGSNDSQQDSSEAASPIVYNIFVGDLSSEVTDEVLASAFSFFKSLK